MSIVSILPTRWLCVPMIGAKANDITDGVGNGLFGSKNSCTRAQIVTFLYRVFAEQ